MKLSFIESYKSITSFDETNLNNFAVITGLNGSGKTHLLNSINLGKTKIEEIEPSEIIFYNYNDFTIHNADPLKDTYIQQKHKDFSGKANMFGTRLQLQRQEALDSFTLFQQIENFRLLEQSILKINKIDRQEDWKEDNFDRLTNWTEEDYILYEQQIQKFEKTSLSKNYGEHINSLKPHQAELFTSLGYLEIVHDIRTFIPTLKSFRKRVIALQLVKFSGYSKRIFKWENTELQNLFPILSEISDMYSFLDGTPHLGKVILISENLRWFIQLILDIDRTKISLASFERMLSLKETGLAIYDEIARHFINKVDPQTLSIIQNANGENILAPINPVSAFLNLHDIEQAEKKYQILKKQNEYAEFEKWKGKEVSYLSSEDFIKLHGDSPVNSLNKVLNEYDCNGYEFRQSELYFSWDTNINDQDIQITLFNKIGKYSTSLDSLSSGERTLLALAFTIYKIMGKNAIAKLLLMDEVDSSLHPSMSKRLMNVLYKLFYKEMNINIIISTHSPSTVSFAPENSTYIMRKEHPRLIEATIDQALRELTEGVPSFSINYENRRQVFVESKYDVEYYRLLYDEFKRSYLNADVSLNFISSGDSETNLNGIGKANSDQVMKITNLLRHSGNKFIWGIIDWDLISRSQQEGIIILGEGNRYSIENYLLDPLLLAVLLWREKLEPQTFFGYGDETKFYEVSNFDRDKLQSLIDKVLIKVGPKIKSTLVGQSNYNTIGGVNLSLPLWFTNCQGHQLEDGILAAFPRLNEIKKNKESALKLAVINKVISDLPMLAPEDLLKVLKQVQIT